MKLSGHVENIRLAIDGAFRNRLGRMGINPTVLQPMDEIPAIYRGDRKRLESIRETWIAETGNPKEAYDYLVEELTFTLFNRLAALKVMEAHSLIKPVITRSSEHGERSFAHKLWLDQHPEGRSEEMEGLASFLEDELALLGNDVPLFSIQHPYHLLPTAIEFNQILLAVNQVEKDNQVESNLWMSDDVLGWLYESYNNTKKETHKDSGDKTEYNKVSIQSQVYTPRWVVQFLVDNSLGKHYLEMYPDSDIRSRYKIANPANTQMRQPKPLTEIKLIDPATGSGNFLLYAFDLFYDLYVNQIEQYGADYDERKIPELIIAHNLHGVDIDDRGVQLAQLGLYIKAKRRQRSSRIGHFNVVSSHFFLPDYKHVRHLFSEVDLSDLEGIVTELWSDLQQAYKFGTLIRLEEKFNSRLQHLIKQDAGGLFAAVNLEKYQNSRTDLFAKLREAVAQNTAKQGQTFLNTKTQDAITFLQLLTQKYDVAVANPPYTDSADFGPELKRFVEANYKQPYKFNTNLYAAFIKRCCEITTDDGYVGMIHPHTFMFIKTFEDVRKYLIEHTHIDLMVDYGLDRVNLFGPGILLDATWYVLSKKKKENSGLYFNITANQQEKAKQASLEQAYEDALYNQSNNRLYTLPQEKLKIIEGWPFIYWISDGFREKFREKAISDEFKLTRGFNPGRNEKYLRFINELHNESAIKISKGGPFKKWYGKVWLIIDFEKNKEKITNEEFASFSGVEYFDNYGIYTPRVGTKGPSFKFKGKDQWISDADIGFFHYTQSNDLAMIYYSLGVLNSKVVNYLLDSLNPTVNITIGDLSKIPFPKPEATIQKVIQSLVETNVVINQEISSQSIIESNFKQSPLTAFQGASLKDRVLAYLNFENVQLTQVLINEAIINELIFEVYELSDADREQVEAKMGVSIGVLPVLQEAKDAFLAQIQSPLAEVSEHILNLTVTTFGEQQIREIKEDFSTLYQSNNDLEEFCIRHQVNPINVWYWFKESQVVPPARAEEIALEFLADSFRRILMADDDGIIPLVGFAGETRLMERFEAYCSEKGFSSAQIMQLDDLLGRPIGEYVEQHFFRKLSDHLNLFMYLPKTPFIWHLSSGPHQGFEAYIIIYKWNQDSLYKLKSSYLSKRAEGLNHRLQRMVDSQTAAAQIERETIRLQLLEIEDFVRKLDDLIASGYNPILDDGVGKNIAPLQVRGMLKAEVLKSTGKNSQLHKYLNADW
jgi:hypothetical protein